MFIIKGTVAKDFERLLTQHRLMNATSDVYYQNARMLNGSHKFLDLASFNEYYKPLVSDIELVTEPVDAFIPAVVDEEAGEVLNDEEVHAGVFIVNRVGPEYEKIDKRVTIDDLRNTLPATHPALVAVLENGNNLMHVKDDIYIYYSMMKYIQKLDEIRLMELSNMTPVIEYAVNNIDLKAIRQHLHSKKINIDKYKKFMSEYMFRPDYQFTVAFYDSEHEDIPTFDLELVMQRLITNIDVKADNTVCVAIYLATTYAISDIKAKNYDAECVKYIRDVLSKIN